MTQATTADQTVSAPRIAITGGHGFLGWHTAVRLHAVHGIVPVRVSRADFTSPSSLARLLSSVDGVVHLAGVNRAETDAEVEQANADIARRLADSIAERRAAINVVYSNSVQSANDVPYGRGKAHAGEILEAAVRASGGAYADVILPNLFGEHGRPHYNSFVATFCHEVAHWGKPTVTQDRNVALMHAQEAAETLIQAVLAGSSSRLTPAGEEHTVAEVLERLTGFHDLYARGDVPPLTDSFAVDLFNTYRSYVFPEQFPMSPQLHSDDRGTLFETVRSHGGTGQAFVSTTVPGATRGDHYHLHKVERFFVLTGEAEISLRRLLHDDVVRFRLSGAQPSFVDMPTMWVHNITNTGSDELVTMFWADQLLDPERPDQYAERVDLGSGGLRR